MKANDQQLMAINSRGSTLVNAGAGSGKTFVIVEHVLKKIEEILDSCHSSQALNPPNFGPEKLKHKSIENEIKIKLSQIVIITFTKKAASEIKERISKRVRDLTELSREKWIIVKENTDLLNITTIHGFFYNVLSSSLLEGINYRLNIKSSIQYKLFIQKTVESYLEKLILTSPHKEIIKFFSNNINTLTSSLNSLFNDTQTRLVWDNKNFETNDLSFHLDVGGETTGPKNFDPENYNNYLLDKMVDLLDLRILYQNNYDFSHIKKSKTLEIWKEIINFFQKEEYLSQKNLFKTMDFLLGIKRLSCPNFFKEDAELLKYFDKIKILRDVLKKNQENLKLQINEIDEFKDWMRLNINLYQKVRNELRHKQIFNFSDMEYLLFLALSSGEEKIDLSPYYKYFVVDELQDTSPIQFSIIKKMIQKKFEKVFCVGDLKQAIYGFRGGEVSVFNECSKILENKISLHMNYRSLPRIVEFNNLIFDELSKESKLLNKTNFESQYAIDQSEQGHIYQLVYHSEKDKLLSKDIQSIDNRLALEKIKKISSHCPEDEICILYRRLAPSIDLITQLIQNKISFETQIKISYREFPEIILFYHIMEIYLEYLAKGGDGNFSKTIFVLNELFSILGQNKSFSRDELIQCCENYKFWGVWDGYLKFIFKNGMSFGDTQGFSFLQCICENELGSPNRIYKRLGDLIGFISSRNFKFGENPKIKIMTVHMSKGLEFDHVILGDGSSFSQYKSNDQFFGKWPLSIKWTKNNDKKTYKSLAYIVEEIEQKQKESQESMRLLYVACTRAKKSLSFPSLFFEGTYFENKIRSWASILTDLTQKIDFEINKEDYHFSLRNNKSSLPPFYFLDSHFKVSGQPSCGEKSKLIIVPDLSVTRLSTLADCSYKFYLSNICRISEEEVSKYLDLPQDFADNDNISMDKTKKSSKERGINLHKMIESFTENSGHNIFLDKQYYDEFIWIQELLGAYIKDESKKLFPEYKMRFKFFDQTLSGVADLVIYDQTRQEIEIWDYKTGYSLAFQTLSRQRDLSSSLWFQLFIYGIGIQEYLTQPKKIIFKIVFLDEKKLLTKELDPQSLYEECLSQWQKIDKLNQANHLHCPVCQFGNICHFKNSRL